MNLIPKQKRKPKNHKNKG